ncbi:hypothetical protein ABMA32_22405 [Mesorhizobium sp. VNQ89]|uniref:hypothetical protein n=1 Tax=Mesorhizobium quangtriensis TaxID=3157709 RepID=UPI0032B73B0B
MSEVVEKKPFEAQKAWRESNPQKVWAQRALRSALKMGMLHPEPCCVCGVEPAEAHHPDYDRPMDVVWLCRKHHKAEHARLKCEVA